MANNNFDTPWNGVLTHDQVEAAIKAKVAELMDLINKMGVPEGGITIEMLTNSLRIAINNAYQKPSTGIPASDLAQAVRSILNDVASKVDAVPGKGLSTEDFTTALLNKLNGIASGAQVNTINSIQTHEGQTLTPNNGVVTLPKQAEVNLDDYYDKDEVDDAISQMQAQIEEENLTVITGDKLSLWLDEDGESINIMAGDVGNLAATPTISHVINNDGTATVTIVNNEQGATIHYTTDGTAPTESSSVYSSALTINTAGSHTIKAIAVVQDKLNSSVATDTFRVESCQTPVIEVDNSASNTATVTATAGIGESVTLSVDGQTATGTGSASVTINKGTSSQTLSASATATATGKLTATATQNVTIDEKAAYVFGAYELGGKAADASVPIVVTTTQSQNVTFETVDGVVYWKVNLQGKLFNISGLSLHNELDRNASIFTSGATNVLTIEHIPEDCVKIRDIKVFSGCTNLTMFKVSHNSALTNINRSLATSTSLQTVVLPSSVTNLDMAFQSDTALTSVSASGVTTIGESTFAGCSALATVAFGQLTTIAKQAFQGCSVLNFAGISWSNVTSFGDSAFRDCAALERFVFPSGIVKIPNYMFYGCTSLNILDLPSDLEEIGTQAFMRGCTQLELVLPSSITKIGSSATQFADIKSVTINSTVPPTLENNGLYGTFPIYVPDNYVTAYTSAWTDLVSRIKPISQKP